jgi:hypothetical protein
MESRKDQLQVVRLGRYSVCNSALRTAGTKVLLMVDETEKMKVALLATKLAALKVVM